MQVIALTGGIGAGKSTVAKLFAAHHIPIIDADVIARELTEPNRPAYHAIIQHFKKENLLIDGTLNRSALKTIIFNHPHERLWLENLLHPLIIAEMTSRLNEIEAPYCIMVIPLLSSIERYPFINRVLVVDTPEILQLERVTLRDHITVDEAKRIMNTQLERDHRLTLADDIIINDGSVDDLTEQVNTLHQQYLVLGSKAHF